MPIQNSKLPWLRSIFIIAIAASLTAGALLLYGPAPPDLSTALVERRDFLRTVTSRGELKSAESIQVKAPQTPSLKIVQIAESGKFIEEGDIVVRFDEAAQEDLLIARETEVRQVDSEIEQAEAQHAITDERNEMLIMQATYNVERAGLEASKQEILAEIEAAKAKIDVEIAEGELKKSEVTAAASDMSQAADIDRLEERKGKAIRDLELSRTYLGSMVLRAPTSGIVHVLPNNRAQGSFGTARPPFQEGDTVWTGASIAEIPDLDSLRVEFRVDEVDRGRGGRGAGDAHSDRRRSGRNIERSGELAQPDCHIGVQPPPSPEELPSPLATERDRRPAAARHERNSRDRRAEDQERPRNSQQGLDANRGQTDSVRQGRHRVSPSADRSRRNQRQGDRRCPRS